ncbi:MAG: hypothetical protein H6760_01455 [Candidatus Nomurabacteria bacterium]|nr:MAG: hypothetical protein H6760_01455 [Candidatus Nomurabacteria bacterium]
MSQQRIPAPQFNNPLLRMNGRCPVCNSLYDVQQLRILAEKEQSILAHLECSNCSTAVLSYLQLSGMGLSNHALITDLTPDEVHDRMGSSPPISSDDIILFHSYLENEVKATDLYSEDS